MRTCVDERPAGAASRRVITPAGAVVLELPRPARSLSTLAESIRGLPEGTWVTLLAGPDPWARARCLRVAAASGMRIEREFLAFPSFRAPGYLVPDAPGTLAYFCHSVVTVPPGTSRLAWPADRLVHLLRARSRARAITRLAPGRIVVGRRGNGAGASVSGDGEGEPYAHQEQRLSLGTFVEASGMAPLVVATSKDPNPKVTVLLFPPGWETPKLAVKAATTTLAECAVEAEGRMLVELHRKVPRGVNATIPRLREVVEFEGKTALVMTAVPGVPMTTPYLEWRHSADRHRVAADFSMVAHWLARFQSQTAGEPAPVDMDGGILSRLELRFVAEAGIDEDLDRFAAILRRLRGCRAPRAAVHGDLWLGNVLVDGSGVTGVVDWELGTMSGEPVRDLVRFAHMYALYLDRHTRGGRRVAGHRGLRTDVWGAGVQYAIEGSGWFPALYQQFLGEGLVRLGVPPERWRDVAVAGIAEVAATTDDPNFARRHLELFRRLTASLPGTHSGETTPGLTDVGPPTRSRSASIAGLPIKGEEQ
jgi:Phosphotransferase enzyme family